MRGAYLIIVGAGKTAEAVAQCFRLAGADRLVVANRTLINAQLVADRCGGTAVALGDLGSHLARADMVVSCTSSESALITRRVVEDALRNRPHKPLFLADLAERINVERDVRYMRDVFFAATTDLDCHRGEGMADDEVHTQQARAILQWRSKHQQMWLDQSGSHVPVDLLVSGAERCRDEALKKAKQLLHRGRDPFDVLEFFAQNLTNKFMHAPSANLRAASLRGDIAFLEAVTRLFECEELVR